MSRIRTIKPQFFTSEDIVALTPLARLLYIGLWCEADREGRMHWKPRTFKMRYLPADDCDAVVLADELVAAGLVVLYGDGLAYIPSFTTHQHVNPRESVSTLPAPPGVTDAGPKKIGKTLRALVIERDGGACVRCGSTDRIVLDHILPQSCGGPHVAENLRVLCKSCNAARPVAGAALDEDLARDGYTIEILRRKFGIDASIPELNAQGGREGKGRERKGRERNDASDDTSCDETEITIPLADGTVHPVTLAEIAEWEQAYPAVDVMAELRKARAWCVANPANRKTGRGIGRFLNSWLSRAAERPGARPNAPNVIPMEQRPGGGRRLL